MIVGDIRDRKAVEGAVKHQDIVYNFAALADINLAKDNPVNVAEINILGNIYVLEAARKAKVKRFIYASSVYVYSSFGTFYSESKLASEKFVEAYQKRFGLPFTILRYGSLYGPARSSHLGSINKFIHQALKERKISYLGTGEEVREYVHIKDAAKLSVQVLENQFTNKNVLITGHQAMKSRDLLMMIKEIFNSEIEIEFLNQGNKEHYHITGYSFQPGIAQKLVSNLSVDMGQGILDLIEEAYRELNPQVYHEHIKHLPDAK